MSPKQKSALEKARAAAAAKRAAAKADSVATETKAPAKPGKNAGQKITKATADAKPAKLAPKASPKADKKPSAIDAALTVLKSAKEPVNTREMIEAMASKKLWTSPGGKTPHATLYSAILREINEKGKEARFTKTERGRFQANV